MSKKPDAHETVEDVDVLHLNNLTVPVYIAHIKPGNTLCANENLFVVQNGPTSIEVRTAPKFEPRKIPWNNGLIRDIVWSPELSVFVLLTQKTLFTFNPDSITAPTTTSAKPLGDLHLKISAYNKIQPFEDRYSFWRCTTVGSRVFVAYSGLATVVDEYAITPSSCSLVKRWLPPRTCAEDEGIWCIRHHPDTDEIGLTIMDGQTNEWRFELRNPRDLSVLWQSPLPLTHGDCEVSPLLNGQWLGVNSCGIRLLHIVNRRLKAAVEYERELRNAISIADEYLVIRTKNTLEIHSTQDKKKKTSSSSSSSSSTATTKK